jgi:hypothetical protein
LNGLSLGFRLHVEGSILPQHEQVKCHSSRLKAR